MRSVERQTLARKLEYLRTHLEMLESYRALTPAGLRCGHEKRLAAERLLELCLQSMIDCSRLLLVLEGGFRSHDERDAILVLADRGVLSEQLAQRLMRAKGFRNILVHEYAEIDLELLSAHLHDGVDDLWSFARTLAARLRGR